MQPNEITARHDYDAFLSYNHADEMEARELVGRLKARRLAIWFDKTQLRPGVPWQGPVERALQQVGSVIVALGSSGIGSWQDEETQLALKDAKGLNRPVIPVFLPGYRAQGTESKFLLTRTLIDFRKGYSEEEIERLVWGITGQKPGSFSAINAAQKNGAATRWILVAGSGGKESVPAKAQDVSERLGEALAIAGFSLVTGGWNGVDENVARAFNVQIQRQGQSLSGRLVQVMQQGEHPEFPAGRYDFGGSEDEAWERSVARADAVVLVGGLGGTYQTGVLATKSGKLVFPLADTRGPAGGRRHDDAYKFYFDMLKNWPKQPLSRVLSEDDFNSLANAAPGVVSDVIRLLKQALLQG